MDGKVRHKESTAKNRGRMDQQGATALWRTKVDLTLDCLDHQDHCLDHSHNYLDHPHNDNNLDH